MYACISDQRLCLKQLWNMLLIFLEIWHQRLMSSLCGHVEHALNLLPMLLPEPNSPFKAPDNFSWTSCDGRIFLTGPVPVASLLELSSTSGITEMTSQAPDDIKFIGTQSSSKRYLVETSTSGRRGLAAPVERSIVDEQLKWSARHATLPDSWMTGGLDGDLQTSRSL